MIEARSLPSPLSAGTGNAPCPIPKPLMVASLSKIDRMPAWPPSAPGAPTQPPPPSAAPGSEHCPTPGPPHSETRETPLPAALPLPLPLPCT